jgi:hypothetical protein
MVGTDACDAIAVPTLTRDSDAIATAVVSAALRRHELKVEGFMV